eukprot:NODE_154_length_16838_cov_0.293327.p4 type:complete len:380 gc:universal NODE_154_length_16838_cov_0.293327:10682-9543(-)
MSKIVIKHYDNFIVKELDQVNWELKPQPQPGKCTPILVTDDLKSAIDTLQKTIITNTIRGFKIMELLPRISYGTGFEIPVFVVGGSICDLIQNPSAKLNDIDLCISYPYVLLKRLLESIYSESGKAFGKETLLCDEKRQSFGMMKLMPFQEEPEALDIGVMKSLHLDDLGGIEKGKLSPNTDLQYLQGYGFDEDTKTRDFTANSIFYSPMTGKLWDPKNGVSDIRGKIVRFSTNDNESFRRDKGGHFRYFKMLKKLKGQVDHSEFEKTSDALVDMFDKHINMLIDDSMKELIGDFGKMYSKLFSKKPFSTEWSILKALITQGNQPKLNTKLQQLEEKMKEAAKKCFELINEVPRIDLYMNTEIAKNYYLRAMIGEIIKF